MKSLKIVLLAAGFALGTLASAQAAQQQQQPAEGYGFVRFVHASPNADVNQVLLTAEDGAAAAAVEQFAGLQYTEMTDFVQVPEGSYDVMVALEGVDDAALAQVVPAQQLNVASGGYYTITLLGLVTPGPEVAEQQEDGFFGWLRDLFSDDAATPGDFGLQLLVLEEDATVELDEQLMRVRIVHAAPGTETIELVADRREAAEADARADQVDVIQAVSYGEVSGFAEFDPREGQLAVRVEGMEDMFVDLALEQFQAGMIHTVFVTGTPVEQVPLEGFVATTQPVTEADVEAAREQERVDAEAEAAEAEAEAEAAEPAQPADAVAQPAQPAQPTTPAVAQPAQPADTQDIAWVRFVDVAPNAEAEQVLLTTGDGVGLTVNEFAGVGYMDASEYVAIPAGNYDISVSLAPLEGIEFAQATPVDSFNASAGQYYTITLMGLLIPEDWAAAQERNEGFFAWLENLFTGDNGRDDLGLRVMVLEDDLAAFWADPAQETHIRLVHAAPGTQSVELVLNRATAADPAHRSDAVDHVGTVAYGDTTGFTTVDTLRGTLEVRIEGSRAVILDLADFQLQPGMMHTIFVTGTPVEDVPIDAVVLTTTAVDAQPAGN